MNSSTMLDILMVQIGIFSLSLLAILGAVIIVGVGYLLFDFFYKTIIQGRTSKISSKIMFLDHAPFTKPYKNYNRLHSQSWNIKNTM